VYLASIKKCDYTELLDFTKHPLKVWLHWV